jgi:hypothetical protein
VHLLLLLFLIFCLKCWVKFYINMSECNFLLSDLHYLYAYVSLVLCLYCSHNVKVLSLNGVTILEQSSLNRD